MTLNKKKSHQLGFVASLFSLSTAATLFTLLAKLAALLFIGVGETPQTLTQINYKHNCRASELLFICLLACLLFVSFSEINVQNCMPAATAHTHRCIQTYKKEEEEVKRMVSMDGLIVSSCFFGE